MVWGGGAKMKYVTVFSLLLFSFINSLLPGVSFVRLWEGAAGLTEIFVGCNCSAKPQWSTFPQMASVPPSFFLFLLFPFIL